MRGLLPRGKVIAVGLEAHHVGRLPMPRILAAVMLLILSGVVGCARGTAPSEAAQPSEPVPASAEATEQTLAESPETTANETPQTTYEEEPASEEPEQTPAEAELMVPQPVGEMVPLDRAMKETCAARAGVTIPEPEDLIAQGDGGFGADPGYLECMAAEGEAVNGMLEEGRSVEEIIEARYGE